MTELDHLIERVAHARDQHAERNIALEKARGLYHAAGEDLEDAENDLRQAVQRRVSAKRQDTPTILPEVVAGP